MKSIWLLGTVALFTICCKPEEVGPETTYTQTEAVVKGVSLPDTVNSGVAFEFTVTMYGTNGCAKHGSNEALVSADTSKYTMYQSIPDGSTCTEGIIEIDVDITRTLSNSDYHYFLFNLNEDTQILDSVYVRN